MKRVVKASFGYRDEDWINPPEETSEAEDDEVVINIDMRLTTDRDGDFDVADNVTLMDNSTLSNDDFYVAALPDPVYDVESFEEDLYVYLYDLLDKPNTTYHIYGPVAVDCTYYVPVGRKPSSYDDVYYDGECECYFKDLKVKEE